MELSKPNLFIVGAPKAGTTFLYEKLKNHPKLYLPKVKELNYFSSKEIDDFLYYKDYKVNDIHTYLDFYKAATNEKYLVDASVSYFSFDSVAHKIAQFDQNAKIVIILREPIQRAFSHYSMDRRMGHAERSFLDYIQEPQRFPAHYFQYVKNSCYTENIERYIQAFGRENVYIMKIENLETDLIQLFEFLEIEDISNSISTEEKINPKKEARNKLASFFLKNRNVTNKLKSIVPKEFIEILKSFFYKKSIPLQISDKEEKVLYEILETELKVYNKLS